MPEGDGTNQGQDGQGQGDGGTPASFEAWLTAQDETVKGLITSHTTGLKSALDSERESRKGLERQLREAAKKADAGSEAQKQLTEMADRLTGTERRIAAYDALSAAGCANLKLAWLAAQDAGLVDGQGSVSVERLKAQFPELFKQGTPAPRGNAGSGAGQGGAPKQDMNAFIRQAAGRG